MFYFFFFNDTATTEIYPLSLHDALPISVRHAGGKRHDAFGNRDRPGSGHGGPGAGRPPPGGDGASLRSEEHTSELQSRPHLVCRLLLEKTKNKVELPKIVILRKLHAMS